MNKQSTENSLITSNNVQNSSNITANINSYQPSKHLNSPKPFPAAIEMYRKLCLKTYTTPNPNLVNSLKQESLNIYLDNYNIKEIHLMNKIMGKFYYFKQIVLAPQDANSKNII